MTADGAKAIEGIHKDRRVETNMAMGPRGEILILPEAARLFGIVPQTRTSRGNNLRYRLRGRWQRQARTRSARPWARVPRRSGHAGHPVAAAGLDHAVGGRCRALPRGHPTREPDHVAFSLADHLERGGDRPFIAVESGDVLRRQYCCGLAEPQGQNNGGTPRDVTPTTHRDRTWPAHPAPHS